ncbi:MAG TPA: PAS domain S-box protein, partial [Blastocatellia bacterium]|nr:PAS domain S-box protein [Blastocatellia bacterium]
EQSRQPVESPVSKVLREGRVVGLANHTTLLTRDGREIPIDDSGAPIRDKAGNISGVVLIFRDIQERKRAEEAARESEERFRTLANSAPVLVWMADAEGQRNYFNKPWLEFTGRTIDQEVGNGWAELVHPDDSQRVLAIYKESFGARASFNMEYRLRRKDGQYRWMLVHGVPLYKPDGGFTGFIGSCMDMTEIKETEEERSRLIAELQNERQRVNNIVATVPGVVWEAWGQPDEKEQRINFVSDYVKPMLGYSVEEWLATPNFWLTIVHPDDRERAAREAAAIFASKKQGTSEFRWIGKDGRVLWVEAQSIVVIDEAGNPVGMRGVSIDVTKRKQVEEELERLLVREQAARAQAEAANRAKDEFLATVSHELRTPLNAILGWTRMLRMGTLDEATSRRALETVERNAKSQTQLIEDILDVSRIITGQLRLDVYSVDLASVIEEAVDSVRPAAEAKDINLQLTLDPNAGPVLGDASRLQQIVWNLVANSVKFTPRGGRVEVRLERVSSQVQVVVSDTGRGISAEFLPYVFDRFRQADSTTTRKFGGLGLGLAIVRHLVEMHGGTVEAESAGEGRGATFIVRLPVKAVRNGPELNGQYPRNAQPDSAPRLDGLRVLAVDDEPDARDLLLVALTQYGAEVRVSASAADALAVLERWKPDVLVSDIEMPGQDGYQLIRALRARGRERGGETPAIALTAYAHTSDRVRALAAGFQQYVAKPVDITELIAVIAAVAQDGARRV